ncbi:hypothetical protein L3Q72_21395 [Vibrio sp. JC009]|uniref:hypothetical protein n=1 Tax=Vibrio sp. JC009 TaxID=2912314 RepID=UPI0023B000E4|nr:hypothetical protein [Vibrio sp. JC009]WED23793.1 hypothetical protein L3Q72_21395 [Vibrio sp. JC009]
MKLKALPIALALATAPVTVLAEQKSDIDMSNPTDVYTSVGVSYGNKGTNLKAQLMLSETKGEHGSKSGVIFEAKNVFNEGDKRAKFSGGFKPGLVNGKPDMVPNMNDEANASSYRLRYGTINTENGTGWSIDAILADHAFYGKMAAIQAGPVITIPVSDNFYIFPVLYAGPVIVEDNLDLLTSGSEKTIGEKNGAMVKKGLNARSSGVDVPSIIGTSMTYARYTINDNWWILGSVSYTQSLLGKEWDDDVKDGGLQLPSLAGEVSLAYQINSHQNIRVNYRTDNSDHTDDMYWVEYNYAF